MVIVLILRWKLATLLLGAFAGFLVVIFQSLVLYCSHSVLDLFDLVGCEECFVVCADGVVGGDMG